MHDCYSWITDEQAERKENSGTGRLAAPSAYFTYSLRHRPGAYARNRLIIGRIPLRALRGTMNHTTQNDSVLCGVVRSFALASANGSPIVASVLDGVFGCSIHYGDCRKQT